MKKRANLKTFISLLFVLFSFVAIAQESSSVKARKKALEKQEEEKEKAAQKSIEAGKKRHFNIQDKAVQKRMKKNKKRTRKNQKKKAKGRRRN